MEWQAVEESCWARNKAMQAAQLFCYSLRRIELNRIGGYQISRRNGDGDQCDVVWVEFNGWIGLEGIRSRAGMVIVIVWVELNGWIFGQLQRRKSNLSGTSTSQTEVRFKKRLCTGNNHKVK